MCEPACFVVTKKQVFWSENGDSHELIIEENGLKEMDVHNNSTFIRVEIVPPERDYRKPLRDWVYKLDQDIKPEWYEAKEVEERCRLYLKDWRKSNVVMPNETVSNLNKYKAAVYGTIKSVHGGTIESVNGGTIKFVYGGRIKSVEGGTIKFVHGDFPSQITGNTTIINYGLLTPEILQSSQAVMVDRSKETVACYVGK